MSREELAELSPDVNECLVVMTMLLKDTLETLNSTLADIEENISKINTNLSSIDRGIRLLCTK